MKFRIAMILASLILMTGCGSFYHKQQTYYVKETTEKANKLPQPRLMAQIVPSTESSGIPLIYHSRKWHGPYTLRLHANPTKTECTYYLLHSFNVRLEGSLVNEKTFTTPLKLNPCEDNIRNTKNHTLYSHSLGDSLAFEEGKMVQLEVVYSQADSPDIRTLLMNGVGEEKQRRSSLWSAYMGI